MSDPLSTPEILSVRLDALDRLVQQKFAMQTEALLLQAREYERRLDMLNHEHARVAANVATYVSREVYDTQHTALEKRITVQEAARVNSEGKAWGIAVTVGVVVQIINLLLIWATLRHG